MAEPQKPGTETKPKASETKARIETAKAEKVEKKVAVPLVPLDFNAIQVRSVKKDDLIAHRRTKGERDKEQVATDNLARRAYDKWVEAGRPEMWLDAEDAGFHLRIPEAQFPTFEKRIRSAGMHYQLAVRLGQRVDVDGYAEVVLVVKDRPKNEKVESETEVKDDEAATGRES